MVELRPRRVASLLGLGTVAFGAAPLAFPRPFARIFGLARDGDPTVRTAIRSVGVRDLATGAALWWTAAHGGDYTPWLLTRIASDAGDAASVALAIRSGARDRRFMGLGGLALGAALTGLGLLAWSRRAEQGNRSLR